MQREKIALEKKNHREREQKKIINDNLPLQLIPKMNQYMLQYYERLDMQLYAFHKNPNFAAIRITQELQIVINGTKLIGI